MNVAATISPAVAAKLRDLIEQLDAATARARAAADGASSWWSSLIGADSTAAALESLALSQANLGATVRAKVARLQDDAAALALLREAAASRWADLGDVEELARSLTLGGAVREVGAETAKDAAGLVAWTAPVALLALAAFTLWKLR